jgi:hypothetical protein
MRNPKFWLWSFLEEKRMVDKVDDRCQLYYHLHSTTSRLIFTQPKNCRKSSMHVMRFITSSSILTNSFENIKIWADLSLAICNSELVGMAKKLDCSGTTADIDTVMVYLNGVRKEFNSRCLLNGEMWGKLGNWLSKTDSSLLQNSAKIVMTFRLRPWHEINHPSNQWNRPRANIYP